MRSNSDQYQFLLLLFSSGANEHLGSARLLWNLAGGKLLQLYRDGAVVAAESGT
jgi:hypothetical protein